MQGKPFSEQHPNRLLNYTNVTHSLSRRQNATDAVDDPSLRAGGKKNDTLWQNKRMRQARLVEGIGDKFDLDYRLEELHHLTGMLGGILPFLLAGTNHSREGL